MRIIPKTAKVKIEFFRNVSIVDVIIAIMGLGLELLIFFTNLGIAKINSVIIITIMQKIASPIIQAIDVFPPAKSLKNPPIPIIGAYTTTLNSIVINCCICCISFVLRVISDAVENSLNSFVENDAFVFSFRILVFFVPSYLLGGVILYETLFSLITIHTSNPRNL